MWSRKTSSTSGYSEMASFDGGFSVTPSRKTSLADEERTGASPERTGGVGAAGLQPPDLGFYEDAIDDRLIARGPPRPSASFPTFQLVVDDADVALAKTSSAANSTSSTTTADGPS